MVGEVEDEVFGLLNRVDLMIMNKFRGGMRFGVSKRCVHPESLIVSLFLEGREILDRNHVWYDEGKEDIYLLGSGLDGFECEFDKANGKLYLDRSLEEIDDLRDEMKASFGQLKGEIDQLAINQEEMKSPNENEETDVNEEDQVPPLDPNYGN